MTGRPLVTLFVMAYAQEAHVAEAVAGAFAQTYAPLEIILSDDASPDGTFAVMERMAAAHDGPHRVILNRNETNLGITAHIDRIMALASGALVIQNAGDDVSEPGRVEALAEAWLASAGADGRRADFVHSSLRRLHPDGALTPSLVHDHRAMGPGATPREVVEFRHKLVGASAAWTPHLFEAFGPIGAHATVEDYPLAFRAALEGGVAYVDRPLLRHRVGGHSDARLDAPARDNLYGFWLKRARWRMGFSRAFLADMTGREFPGRAEAEALCRRRLALEGFTVDIADASRGARLAMLPRAAWLALRWRDAQPLKDWAKYAFDRLYLAAMGREGAGGGGADAESRA